MRRGAKFRLTYQHIKPLDVTWTSRLKLLPSDSLRESVYPSARIHNIRTAHAAYTLEFNRPLFASGESNGKPCRDIDPLPDK